ncbi:MAG: aspartyl protease family protein [Oscillospiraceae bacterium]|nr:aspartyl protease family protein [Oscillospiraceae bacterium]
MAHYFSNNFQIKLTPAPTEPTNIAVQSVSFPLMHFGFNMPVIVNSVPLDKENLAVKSKLVMAHFDTGASITCVDDKLADELGLNSVGMSTIQTANNLKDVNQYIVEVTFPNTELKGYCLSVNACSLPYNPSRANDDPQNFGVLLGRDIMANWNIVWNGPTSTVIISD